MAVVDPVPHPQAVFSGFEPDDPGLLAMRSLVANSMLTAADQEPTGWRSLDWDIWVAGGATTNWWIPEHMHVLAMGAPDPGLVRTSKGAYSLSYGDSNHSPTMHIPEGLSEVVLRLVRDDLIPWLTARETRPVLSRKVSGTYQTAYQPIAGNDSRYTMIPFVLDADSNVIAGAFRRQNDSWIWILPHVPERPELWLTAALSDWHERTPSRVPVGRPWQLRSNWMTGDEVNAATDLAALGARRKRWERLFAARQQALEARQLNAGVAAAAGLRRLLTAHDDDLVDAVASALTYLGLTVTDEDAARAEDGLGKAHDLNVTDPDAPHVRVIAEIKGYSKGARRALPQATQHILRYSASHAGRMPDRCWLIVNHFRDHDPDERPVLLQGADEDIALFAENGGLVIDTRDLFRIVRRIEDGEMTEVGARQALRQATGRFAIT